MPLLSFHNKPALKKKYVNRLKAHHAADEIIKGKYWENGKGCAVGCVIHSGDHHAYETELGLPEWLARLEDTLFENLPNGHAKQFAVDLLDAIPVGVNLEPVKWRFCSFILGENLERVKALDISGALKKQVTDAIAMCRKVHDDAIVAGFFDESAAWSAWSAAESARSAAWSAAESARSAAESARSAAESAARSAAWSAAESAARSAAESAWSAARSAARSAAESAWSAARSAAWSAAYIRYADKLLELLRAA